MALIMAAQEQAQNREAVVYHSRKEKKDADFLRDGTA